MATIMTMSFINTDLTVIENSTVMATAGQVSTELDGRAVILDVTSGTYYELNEVGSRVWALIQTATRVTAIHEQLLAEYDVDTELCMQDLLALLRHLASVGLIQVER
jgi:hypothetical protein